MGRLPPRLIDVGLALAVTVAVTVAMSVAREPGTDPPDALAYALGVMIAILLLARRRWPVAVLVASFVTLNVYYLSNYPSMSPAVPLAVALYTAAAAGHLRWSLGVVVWYLVGGMVWLVVGAPGAQGSLIFTFSELVRDDALLLAVLLFGNAIRSRRELMAETSARLQRAEEDRNREAQELSAARVIQQQLLPKELPPLPGWRVAAYYQPARAVGGDFYDILALPDGQVGFVIGDVTDKGIPAALVMATTHSILRGEVSEVALTHYDAPALVSPGAVLERANDRLYPDIPAHMFVTCLYAVLDPATGRLRYANAGHNLPYLTTTEGATALRATGMPLGAMPHMTYEEKEVYLGPGDGVLFHSDGLVEAHNAAREMFGFPRLRKVVEHSTRDELVEDCLSELRAFVGRDWEQEDDITLLSLQRTTTPALEVTMSGVVSQQRPSPRRQGHPSSRPQESQPSP